MRITGEVTTTGRRGIPNDDQPSSIIFRVSRYRRLTERFSRKTPARHFEATLLNGSGEGTELGETFKFEGQSVEHTPTLSNSHIIKMFQLGAHSQLQSTTSSLRMNGRLHTRRRLEHDLRRAAYVHAVLVLPSRSLRIASTAMLCFSSCVRRLAGQTLAQMN